MEAAVTLGAALVALHAFGQSVKQPRRVALLTTSSEAIFASSLQAVRDGLREHGYAQGRDIVIDIRYADGREQELNTAKALGITIPRWLLLRSDEVIR